VHETDTMQYNNGSMYNGDVDFGTLVKDLTCNLALDCVRTFPGTVYRTSALIDDLSRDPSVFFFFFSKRDPALVLETNMLYR
jgi:hypothetical protein